MVTESLSSLRVQDVRFEHCLLNDGLGVGDSRPKISWRVVEAPAGFYQKKYQIEFFSQNPADAEKPSESFGVESGESILVP